MKAPTPQSLGDVSRRQILTTTGTLVAGGAVVATASSTPAKGAVSATALDIPPATHEGEDGSVQSLPLTVSGNCEFATDGAETVALALEVAPENGENYGSIDQIQDAAMADSGAGQYSMSGDILAHPALSAGDFSAQNGEEVQQSIPVRVIMDVQASGETVVSAAASTVAEITVINSSVVLSASVSGGGEVGIEV